MPRPWVSHQSSLSQSSASVPLKVQLLFLRDPPTPRQCIILNFQHIIHAANLPPILLPPTTSAAPAPQSRHGLYRSILEAWGRLPHWPSSQQSEPSYTPWQRSQIYRDKCRKSSRAQFSLRRGNAAWAGHGVSGALMSTRGGRDVLPGRCIQVGCRQSCPPTPRTCPGRLRQPTR